MRKTGAQIGTIVLAAVICGLVGCSASKGIYPDRKRSFHTPSNWKKPIAAESRRTPIQNGKGASAKSPTIRTETAFASGSGSKDGGRNRLRASAEREQMDGYASWYGRDFHGKLTANGERYNQNEMTAAHKILPMNSIVKVTNVENGRSAVVRINDRGPYKKNRIIDLTKKAAKILGFEKQGTARVSLEVLSYPKDFDHSQGLKPYKQVVVQVAVFKDIDRADRLKAKLQKRYARIPFLVDRSRNGRFSVAAGPFDKRSRAKQLANALQSDGVSGFVRSYRK